MSELTEFLLARIEEDEAVAAGATPGPWRTFADAEGGVWAKDGYGMAATGCGQGNADHIVRNDPARVLADCAGRRRIVERLAPITEADLGCACDRCMTLRDLASVYADHPDYRQEWKP